MLQAQLTKCGTARDVLEITGKGSKSRVVPVMPILADHLRKWQAMIDAR